MTKLLNPEELPKRKPRVTTETDTAPLVNSGGKAVVNFESHGRFDTPETLTFKDFNVRQVTDLSLSSQEKILENIIVILNDMIIEDLNYDTRNLTVEEFLEVLVALKVNYESPVHEHQWICECQYSEENPVPQSTIVDLSKLKYKSIEEVDKKYQEQYKKMLDSLSEDQFKEHLMKKYASNPLDDIDNWSKAQESSTAKVKEPFYYIEPETGNKFGFEMMKVKHLALAQQLAKKEYGGKIAMEEKKPHPQGMPLAEFKAGQEDKIKTLREEQAKLAILYTKALTLLTYNDKIVESNKEKLSLYENMSKDSFYDIINFLNDIDFGVSHEIKTTCSHCGKQEGRWLQQDLNPIELLPLDPDSKRDKRDSVRLNVYFS